MNSDLPKVLHEAAGKTLLTWVLDALSDAGCHDQIVVVGYGGEKVRAHVGARSGVDSLFSKSNLELVTPSALQLRQSHQLSPRVRVLVLLSSSVVTHPCYALPVSDVY